ncbi:hypothetical protein ES708_11545 [subsurface metagenome]
MPVCKRCYKEVEHLSKRGLCMDCGIGAVRDAAIQLHQKKGPIYEKYLSRSKASRERIQE